MTSRYYNMMKSKGDASRKRRRAERDGAEDAQDSDAEDAASGEESDVGELHPALPAFMDTNSIRETVSCAGAPLAHPRVDFGDVWHVG